MSFFGFLRVNKQHAMTAFMLRKESDRRMILHGYNNNCNNNTFEISIFANKKEPKNLVVCLEDDSIRNANNCRTI
jgi:hypothetical protein